MPLFISVFRLVTCVYIVLIFIKFCYFLRTKIEICQYLCYNYKKNYTFEVNDWRKNCMANNESFKKAKKDKDDEFYIKINMFLKF